MTEMADGHKTLCVLTVHGIGFEQPPRPPVEGYADELHKNLREREELAGKLGDDPDRPGCPVYVQSAGPRTPGAEQSLSRLDGPLTAGGEPIAHVALVYSPLESVDPPPGAAAGTLADAGLMLGHYTSIAGAVRLVIGDTLAAIHEHGTAGRASPSLRPRTDLRTAHQHLLARMWHRPANIGTLGIIRAMEHDVVAYICRNDLREQIRAFIDEALSRLLTRNDVSGVVVNAHSQGTVDCFDVLRRYPANQAGRVRAFVTSGSPLRKYADMFSWGNDAGELLPLITWQNYWDAHDPVADPLDPPASWRFGDAPDRRPEDLGLFRGVSDHGTQTPFRIDDHEVSNLDNVPADVGGLRAHDYWDNKPEFIAEMATLLATQ